MMRILVVDDEPSVRALLGTVFADEGYTVQTASDGCAALMLLATGHRT